MKYCTHCGAQLLDEAIICPECGCWVNQPKNNQSKVTATVQPNFNVIEEVKPKLNALSLVGFILSIVAVFVTFFTVCIDSDAAGVAFVCGVPLAIAGFVCSIVGLVRAKRNKQHGKGFAITGIVLGAALCALWILIFLISLVIGIYALAMVYMLLFLIFAAI